MEGFMPSPVNRKGTQGEMVEMIVSQFEGQTRVGPKNNVLDVGLDPPRK